MRRFLPLVLPLVIIALFFFPKSDPAVDAQSQNCRLTRVSDGDTIVCSEEKIRLCGIDAPEISQPLGEESRQKLVDFLQGKEIVVSPIERDRYGRLVAEVFVLAKPPVPGQISHEEELFINAEMVRSGMAYHYDRYSGNCPGKSQIIDAENEARSRSIGVWAGNHERPWDYRRRMRS